ncbi:unnamed protein product [Dicrocoelium dendriticum]|nr:unnamed protein product [Dicrocoelium dendriticum]
MPVHRHPDAYAFLKEKRIYDLKKKNQELEKFKFVLDYKIKELKKQIEPRENDIKNYKEQIQEMESELQRFHKQNNQLEINIAELRQKYKSVEKELIQERQATRDVEALVRRFKTDLFNCVGAIQDPKTLKSNVVALYKKHIHEDMSVQNSQTGEASVDSDIQKEFARQREHLERSIAGLRKKLAKDTELHHLGYVRVMQENVSLIAEINSLRQELKLCRNRITELEATLGLNRKQGETARQLLNQLSKNRPDANLRLDYEQAQRTLNAQQEKQDPTLILRPHLRSLCLLSLAISSLAKIPHRLEHSRSGLSVVRTMNFPSAGDMQHGFSGQRVCHYEKPLCNLLRRVTNEDQTLHNSILLSSYAYLLTNNNHYNNGNDMQVPLHLIGLI